MTYSNHKKTVHGFTLLEVLIALVVLSIGLLGLAGMQLSGLQASNDSYARSQATLLAYDIADRMRANVPGAQAGGYLWSPTGDAEDTDNDGLPDNPGFDCESTFPGGGADCDGNEMALADRFSWFTILSTSTMIPGGSSRIQCQDIDATDADPCSAGSVHTVTVMWAEPQFTQVDTNCPAADQQVGRVCFQVDFAL